MHRYERYFGTGVSSAQAFLRHGRFFGSGVSSTRTLLRQECFFGRSVSSARAFLRYERFFGTGVSSLARKYEALSNASQREMCEGFSTHYLCHIPEKSRPGICEVMGHK